MYLYLWYMNTLTLKSFGLILVLTFLPLLFESCLSSGDDDEIVEQNGNPYEFAYEYFPNEHNYQWIYSLTITNGSGTDSETKTVTGTYDKSKNRIDYVHDNQSGGYANWYNRGNRLECCNGSILIDYDQLDCDKDSVIIESAYSHFNNDSTFIQKIQYCKTVKLEIEGYKDIECVRTFQTNTFSDGSILEIERFFGHGIGLMYNKQTSYYIDGRINKIETRKLISHVF